MRAWIVLILTLLNPARGAFAQKSAPVDPVSSTAATSSPARDAEPNQAGVPNAPPTVSIRVSTRMVLLDVLATGGHGKFASGLKADQFSVSEDGAPQKVIFFSESNHGEQLDSTQNTAHKPPSTIFTNRPDPTGKGGLVLILLDGLNTAAADQAYARQQALRFLRTQLKADQKVAVFALANELLMLQDFTDRTDLLLKAISAYVPNKSRSMSFGEPTTISPEVAAAMPPRALESLKRFNQERAVDAIGERVRITQWALRAIARSLVGRPGRKSLIWISAGFPSSILMQGSYSNLSRSFRDEIQGTSSLLLQAQIALYPVDVRGLVAEPRESGTDELFATVESPDNSFGDDDVTHNKLLLDASQATMEEMASETGGHAFYNGNDLSRAIARAVEESSSYYTLGYYPSNKKWDGKFRKVKVSFAGAKVTLRTRRGYYAIDPTQPETTYKGDQADEISAAIVDPLPSTGVLFTAGVLASREMYEVNLLIDPATLAFEPEAQGRSSCSLDLAAAVVTSEGKFNRITQSATVQFTAAQYQTVRDKGLPLRLQIHSMAKESSIHLAVRDRRSGLLGTLVIDLPLRKVGN